MYCNNCGVEVSDNVRFCSQKCRVSYVMSGKVNKRFCDQCGKEFFSYFCKSNRQKFCSPKCKTEHHKAKKRETNCQKLASANTGRTCDYCQEKFQVERGRNLLDQKFCSKECHIEYYKQLSREATAEQRASIIRQCPVCEKDFTPEKTMKQKYCSRRCCYMFPKRAYATLSRCLQMVGGKKENRAHEILGYTPLELQAYIQSHPNWPKVKDGPWHLDHVFPIIAFVEHGIKDIGMMCMLENLQPLSDNENHKKNKNYDEKAFLQFLKKHGVQC